MGHNFDNLWGRLALKMLEWRSVSDPPGSGRSLSRGGWPNELHFAGFNLHLRSSNALKAMTT
jgi:hypothetical protein